MKADLNYKFGPLFGKTNKENYFNKDNIDPQLKNNKKLNITNETDMEEISINKINIVEVIEDTNCRKINYFNNKKNNSKNLLNMNINIGNVNNSQNNLYNENNNNFFVPIINFNNQQSSFETDFIKLKVEEKINLEKIIKDPSKIIKKLANTNENNINLGKSIKLNGDLYEKTENLMKDSELKCQNHKFEMIKEKIIGSEEESNHKLLKNNLKTQDNKFILYSDNFFDLSNSQNNKNDKILNWNSKNYSNNFPSKDVFKQSISNQNFEIQQTFPHNSKASFYTDDSEHFNSPIMNTKISNNLDINLNNKNGFNKLSSPSQNNFNPINYYQYLDINNLLSCDNNLLNQENENFKINQQNFGKINTEMDIKKNLENLVNKQILNDTILNNNKKNFNRLKNSKSINLIINENKSFIELIKNVSNPDYIDEDIRRVNIPYNNSQNNYSKYNLNYNDNNTLGNNIPKYNYHKNIIFNQNYLSNHLLTNQCHNNNLLNFPLIDLNHLNAKRLVNNQNMRLNLPNNIMMQYQTTQPNNMLYGNINMFNNNIPNSPNIISNVGPFNQVNNNFINEIIFRNQISKNNNENFNNIKNSTTNLNNLNCFLQLSYFMNNYLNNSQNKNNNNMVFNNLLNILPLIKQMNKIYNIPNENFQGRDNKTESNSNSILFENINELLIIELENIFYFSNKIDETVFVKIKNNFIILLKSQNGSRVFQKYLKNTHPLLMKKIFSHIYPLLIDLLMDPYANYFCQKFFMYLEKDDRLEFLKKV